ncbi:MAG: type II toxin-antitoxin system PemK/MazF family toxin [Steroidobacteraceae bacterium]
MGPSRKPSHQHQRKHAHAGVPSRFGVDRIAKPRVSRCSFLSRTALRHRRQDRRRVRAERWSHRTCRSTQRRRQESVVNVSQPITLDKTRLTQKVARLPAESLRNVEARIR